MGKKRILSGIRPTGRLHLGNYVGALQNWVKLQEEYQCFYMVADWHALTSDYENTSDIKSNIDAMYLDWLAAGLDPDQSVLFIQSKVKQHAELFLLLSMFAPLPWLERCPTYKEALQQITDKDLRTYGFLGYPILQAADILIYKADAVPVGEDQLPHLELTREIARKVNFLYEKVFVEPKEILSTVPKLLGTDGRKMSKSYENCIYLSDNEKTVNEKTREMVTDPARVKRTDKGHPEVCSVFDYQKVFTPDRIQEIADGCRQATLGCVDCKKTLAKSLNALLDPMRKRREEILAKPDYIQDVIREGNKRAAIEAEKTMVEARRILKMVE
ncbi:tryptophan--tRNA ligase [Candidatus Sumerlaeota bacterium]|nr:tryptophan--tRNA ligase [Candidatus Sumerlaeota bacterium]